MVGFLKLTEKHIVVSKNSKNSNIFVNNMQDIDLISINNEYKEDDEERDDTVIENCIENIIEKNREFSELNAKLSFYDENFFESVKNILSLALTVTEDTINDEDLINKYINLQKEMINIEQLKRLTEDNMSVIKSILEKNENEFSDYINILEAEKEKLENSPNRDEDAIENLKTTIEELKEEITAIRNESEEKNSNEEAKRQEINNKLEELKQENDIVFDENYNITISFDDGSIQKIRAIKDDEGKNKLEIIQ